VVTFGLGRPYDRGKLLSRRGWTAIVAFVAVLLVACSGGAADRTKASASRPDSGVDESKPPLRPDGPLRGLVMATGIGQDRALIDPRLAFATGDKAATAVVGLGTDVPDRATLTVAWYRLRGVAGREHLFSHRIIVGPGGRAHSQGVAQKGLAPGVYETVATMGDRQVRAPWVVRVAAEPRRYGASSAVFLSIAGQSTSTLEDWEVPSPGESGWDGDLPPTPEGPPPDVCTVDDILVTMSPMTDLLASSWLIGPCSTATLTATVSGPPVTVASDTGLSGVVSSIFGQTDICELPGGSDLPGTVVRFEVTGSASHSRDYALPDLGGLLVTGVESLPEAGSRVKAGDTIKLHALAMLMPPALGVEVLYVDDGTDLIESVGNLSGSDEPVPCDLGRYYARLVTDYPVPSNPPPIIEICANAAGFDGTKAKDCIQFYTGEVWKGTYAGTVTFDCGAGRQQTGTLEAEFKIIVADGVATMNITHTVTGSCAGPDVGTRTTPIAATGERTPTGFEFASFGALFGGSGSLTITVSGDRGTGTILITDLAPGIAMVELAVEITRA
jgi:hypothetical protein